MSYATGGKTIDYFQEAKATTDSDDDDKSDDESTQSTSNRLSNTSNLDNVSLDDEAASRAVDGNFQMFPGPLKDMLTVGRYKTY